MNDVARTDSPAQSVAAWGSDAMADMLRALEIPYIALTPGASFRGLHDSLVNHLGNTRPELLLCIHEETAVALAHGYARVTGRPLAVALHANVGLMHATMAIFNAWCDRIPMLLLGGVGPLDAMKRRPWVDWIHTSRDLGALVRGYTKWDDLPGSVPAALEAMLRAYRIAMTLPQGPTYVALDAGLQEEALAVPVPLPALDRYPHRDAGRGARHGGARGRASPRGGVASARHDRPRDERSRGLRRAASRWPSASAPSCSRTSRRARRFRRAIRCSRFPPSLYVTGEAARLIVDADVILSLDWIDLGGTLRQACGGELPRGHGHPVLARSVRAQRPQMDYQAVPPTDLNGARAAGRAGGGARRRARRAHGAAAAAVVRAAGGAAPPRRATRRSRRCPDVMPLADLARVTMDTLAPHRPSYIRLPLGWPGESCRFEHPQDYIGFDGGGGIGSGPGMAVGAALALTAAIGCRSRCWATATT